jgi:CRP/FNR family transcriptional regulator, cyclic AMP receptor protein
MNRVRSRYQSTRSGKIDSMPSSFSPLAAPAARARLREAALSPGAHDQWPLGTFVGRLAADDRVALLSAGTLIRFSDDQILLVQGDAGDFLYVLVSGLVKVIVAASSGVETTLALRSRGDLVGEFALLDEQPRTATARAVGDVAALRIGGAAFMSIAGGSPAMQATVTRYLLAKMRASTERRAAERLWDAKERLVQVLYELARVLGEVDSVGGAVKVPITQGDLGDLAGVAVSTAERVLADLRRHGVISTRYREIIINDMPYLDSIRFSA